MIVSSLTRYRLNNNIYNKNSQTDKSLIVLKQLNRDIVSFNGKPTNKIIPLNDPVLDSIQDIVKKYQVYVVGGYMRDYFAGKQTPHDWDLVCKKNAKKMAEEIAKKKNGTFIILS